MTSPSSPNDEELLRLMSGGNEEAFVTIYRRRHQGIYEFALQMSGSKAVAEDVTQEVFMALVREPQRYDSGRGSLAAYLYGVARHQVLRVLERERSYVSIPGELETDSPNPAADRLSQDDPLGDLTRSQEIDLVRQAVLALPPHYREVVVLCELQEMSYVASAAVLGCSVGTVRSRLHRARALLIDKFRGTCDVPKTRCLT